MDGSVNFFGNRIRHVRFEWQAKRITFLICRISSSSSSSSRFFVLLPFFVVDRQFQIAKDRQIHFQHTFFLFFFNGFLVSIWFGSSGIGSRISSRVPSRIPGSGRIWTLISPAAFIPVVIVIRDWGSVTSMFLVWVLSELRRRLSKRWRLLKS